ncbi:MAG: hypothetical protein DMF87_14730 [Acidobacteria bacterium]|nr:MAG: hypothetical protein DMF87_14730 [Acidobacteriota bacterium]
MDVVLLTITTLSLAAAAGFGFLSWRVGREERERDRARVAALATAMSPSGPDTPLLAGVAVGSVFERTTDGLRGRLMIKVAAGAMMLLLIGGGVMVSSWMSTSSVEATKSAAPLDASGRAPLDFDALAPGDESPFIVNVPNVTNVARYRVTFRSGDTVVRHIDRRSNQVQLAQAVR